MKILLYSGIDPNGQGQQLAHYIRTNTKHKAVNVVGHDFYLDYPADVILKHSGKPTRVALGYKQADWENFKLEEAIREYDFTIFRWVDPNLIRRLRWAGLVSASNCLIKFHGSEARKYPDQWHELWKETGITYVVNGYDHSMARELGYSVQHIPPMVNCEAIWKLQLSTQMKTDGAFWIAHAPTDPRKKGTNLLFQAVEKLKEQKYDVKVEFIRGKSWKETIQLKGACHALYDQISMSVGIGTFGVNLLEGLAQSKICFGGYNKFTYSYYPDLAPGMGTILNAHNVEELVEQIKYAYNYREKTHASGYEFWRAGREFVTRRFDTKIVGRQWVDLIEFIKEGGSA